MPNSEIKPWDGYSARKAFEMLLDKRYEMLDFDANFLRIASKEDKQELTVVDLSLQIAAKDETSLQSQIITGFSYCLERRDFMSPAERATYDKLYTVDLPQLNSVIDKCYSDIRARDAIIDKHAEEHAHWGKTMSERSAELREEREENRKNKARIDRLETENKELNNLVESLRTRALELSETVDQDTKKPVIEANRALRKAQTQVHKLKGVVRFNNFAHESEVTKLRDQLATAEAEKAELVATADFWKKYARMAPEFETLKTEPAIQQATEQPRKKTTIHLSAVKDSTLNFYL